jgi:uncharacterized membrane protein (DUF2068 family)
LKNDHVNTKYTEVIRGGWLLAAVAILLIAAFLRFYRLNVVPPGLNFDEAGDAVAATDVLKGSPYLFWRIGGGKEPFWPYLLALSFLLGGPTPFVLRLTAALTGLLTVAATYAATRFLFAGEGEGRARWLAGLVALGLATSYWHLSFSRLGLRVITMPLFLALCTAFLWKGVRDGGRRWFLLSGLLLGGSLYTYTGARLWPLAIAAFFLLDWLLARGSEQAMIKRYRRPLTDMALVALAVASPLLAYFIFNPADFLARASATSFINPQVSHGLPLITLLEAALKTFGAFGFTADNNWLLNLPGRSIFSPFDATLFWIGVLISCLRLRRPAYLFTLVWWAGMLAPAIVAPAETPHYLRTLGAAPAAYIFPALTLVALAEEGRNLLRLPAVQQLGPSQLGGWRLLKSLLQASLGARNSYLPLAGALLVTGAVYGLAAYGTYHHYFEVWARNSDALYLPFDLYAVELVEEMTAETTPGAVYILPRDIRAGGVHQHFTIDFLYHGTIPYHYLKVDESTIAQELTAYCRGRNLVHLIRWKADKHQEADPKELLPFLFTRYGTFLGGQSHRAYDVLTYRLPSLTTTFSLGADLQPVSLAFGKSLSLTGLSYGPTPVPAPQVQAEGRQAGAGEVASGEEAWVVLRWHKGGPVDEDYKVSLVLVDNAGHLVGQKDRALTHNWHMGTSGWLVGEEVLEYYLLPVWPATPPGTYHLEAAVYSPATSQRLPVAGRAAARLGDLTIGPALRPVDVTALSIQRRIDQLLARGLRLIGYEPPLPQTINPGGRLDLALYWQGTQEMEQDYRLHFLLRGPERDLALGPAVTPVGDAYPTNQWRPDEVWRGWQRLTVPAEAPPGQYQLLVQAEGAAEPGVVGEVGLGSAEVTARSRLFEAPPIEHPLEANLSGKVKLLGYEIKGVAEAELQHSRIQAGGVVTVTLYWQGLAEMDTSYTVFVHLLDGAGEVRAQRDAQPGDGALPTTGWLPGEVIRDPYELTLPTGLPQGRYQLEIGMYDPVSGARLPLLGEGGSQAGDHVLLPESLEVP